MEKRINQIIETFMIKFKHDIRLQFANEQFQDTADKDKIVSILEFINEYPHLVLTRDNITKPKRVKPEINIQCRCNAKRANNEQCTRRKKSDSEFCGTHAKGAPNGIYNEDAKDGLHHLHKIEVQAVEIHGIVYYVDATENVYSPEDVLSQKQNPAVIAKYTRSSDTGKYCIPHLGLV
jgi:hypothetical protein